jgi:hypothetical protein
VKKEEIRRKKEARKGLSEEEVKKLDAAEAREEELQTLARKIHSELFSEEYDFMYDSYSDSQSRKQGENPMSEEYIRKVSERRQRLKVPPLLDNGMPPENNNSFDIARKLAEERFVK